MTARNHKSTVYVRPTARDALEVRRAVGAGISDVLCTTLERYDAICTHYLPELSPDQWNFIYAALRAWRPESGATSAEVKEDLLHRLRKEAENRQETSRAYNVIKKITELSLPRIYAVIDWAERYWIADEKRWRRA